MALMPWRLRIYSPGISMGIADLVANRRIHQKLALISLLVVLPLAFVMVSLVLEKNKAIVFAQKELIGDLLLTLLRDFHVEFQLYVGDVEATRQSAQVAPPPAETLQQRLQAIAAARDSFAEVAVDDGTIS